MPSETFSDNEIMALLSGVLKHGENNWEAILKDYDFPKERKINCLARKWMMLKKQMNDDLSRSVRSEQEWLLKAIRKIERRKCVTISEGNTIREE